ncbi:hypothetical protein FIBSPDRAFT_857765 [Athelia psychrophila]|uniref:Uncharacterized protein n=1 Tax=Athelia psychrophila TaxID=1759441 RepID=A0A166MH14_9AGAM|nr:hypothetical protein FIBSPDRAFT_857765 [Fibularhizoctonia sp. CBS 109695]
MRCSDVRVCDFDLAAHALRRVRRVRSALCAVPRWGVGDLTRRVSLGRDGDECFKYLLGQLQTVVRVIPSAIAPMPHPLVPNENLLNAVQMNSL